MPEITFRIAEGRDKSVLRQMVELYQYDMTEFWPHDLNEHGEFGFIALERYFKNPDLRAYLLLADDKYAGFGLVDHDVKLASSEFWMGQFFVLKKYRRLGIGRKCAHFIFDQFPGKWEIGQMRLNKPARQFWVRTIEAYTSGNFVEHDICDERWNGYVQCFDNSHLPQPQQ